VSWAQRTPKKLRLEPTSEQLQRCGCPYVLRQAVPNCRCGSSKGTVTDCGALHVTANKCRGRRRAKHRKMRVLLNSMPTIEVVKVVKATVPVVLPQPLSPLHRYYRSSGFHYRGKSAVTAVLPSSQLPCRSLVQTRHTDVWTPDISVSPQQKSVLATLLSLLASYLHHIG